MTQFEEAAIGIANRSITDLLGRSNDDDKVDPIHFLEEVDNIQTEYSKTIAFWDVQVNYPTSQLSIDMIRSRFNISEKRETLKRNQEQLQLLYGTKNDKNDRENDIATSRTLALISMLAIFSALVDGHELGKRLPSSFLDVPDFLLDYFFYNRIWPQKLVIFVVMIIGIKALVMILKHG